MNGIDPEVAELADLILDAQPYGVFLNATVYARELIATRDAERECLRDGRWILTKWESVLP